MYLMVSDALMELDDSHTYILPPVREREPEYGFTTMMVGDRCLVTSVKPDGEAYVRGLRSGDQILTFGTIAPTRRNHWKIKLLLYALNPVSMLQLTVSGVDGKRRQLEIQSTLVSSKERQDTVNRLTAQEIAQPFTCKDISADLIACKVRTFEVNKEAFRNFYMSIATKKRLILDLRGNRNGFEDTVLDFTGHFFAKDVVGFSARGRNKKKERIARGRNDAFTGEVAIVLDSESAGVAEIFARVIQLENRGKVYGDISAGAVIASEVYIVQLPRVLGQQPGTDILALMGVSVSEPIMRDGSSLERRGVIPDEPLGPSGYAIREGLDPILSHVLGKMGAKISPKEAAAFGFAIPRRIEMIDVPSKPTKNEVKTPATF
jgi:C-terminal processing protease CtpA/Prc